MRFFLFFLFVLLAILIIPTSADLGCEILASCPTGSTALLYMKNDSGGFDNAHAQLPSSPSYSNILCCNSSYSSVLNTCGVTFLELSADSNAHAQDPAYAAPTAYTSNACLSSSSNVSCTVYTTGCPAGKTCLVSMASSGSSNQTDAHVGSCNAYDTDLCCSINAPPNNVSLYDPANGNETMLNPKPTLTWYNTTDPDTSTLTYQLQVDEVSSEFQSPVVDVSGIAEGSDLTSYTITSDLSLDVNYSWRVRAYDALDYGNWSDNWTFVVASTVILTLLDTPVNFGTMAIGESNNTLTNSPFPIRVRNEGNVIADINITTDQYLWNSIQTASSYFQYQINNATADGPKGYSDESGSFNWSDSSTGSWYNIPLTNTTASIRQLNFSDASDEAEVDLRVEVPPDEPPGDRGASIVVTGVISS